MASTQDEKLGVEIEARVVGLEDPITVSILVEDHRGREFGPDELDEYLERQDTFLLVSEKKSGRERLLSKETLMWLKARLPPVDLSEAELFETQRSISVVLSDGTTVAGHILYAIGDPNAPLEEFMNSQGDYFELVDGNDVYFIHKSFVSWIDEESV